MGCKRPKKEWFNVNNVRVIFDDLKRFFDSNFVEDSIEVEEFSKSGYGDEIGK
jgi:hypothetical protein